jgi:hypothetical protein
MYICKPRKGGWRGWNLSLCVRVLCECLLSVRIVCVSALTSFGASVHFAPHAKSHLVASASHDATVRLWCVRERPCVRACAYVRESARERTLSMTPPCAFGVCCVCYVRVCVCACMLTVSACCDVKHLSNHYMYKTHLKGHA